MCPLNFSTGTALPFTIYKPVESPVYGNVDSDVEFSLVVGRANEVPIYGFTLDGAAIATLTLGGVRIVQGINPGTPDPRRSDVIFTYSVGPNPPESGSDTSTLIVQGDIHYLLHFS